MTTALKAWQDILRNKNVNSLNNLIAEDTVFLFPAGFKLEFRFDLSWTVWMIIE